MAFATAAADNNDDDEGSSKNPVVVFCPFAAKGAQTVGGDGAAAAAAADNGNDNDEVEANTAGEDGSGVAPVSPGDAATSTSTATTAAATAAAPRRRKEDIVTATAFWLVDATLNRVIGRLEKAGLIAALTALVAGNEAVAASHVASHRLYSAKVLSMLPTEGQRSFFAGEFLHNANPDKLKFGNQAVGHAPDLKCAHALVAQALVPGLRPCPLGEVVIGFIMWLGNAVATKNAAAKAQEGDATAAADDSDEARPALPNDWHAQLIPLFTRFAANFPFVAPVAAAASSAAVAGGVPVTAALDATDLVRCAKTLVDTFADQAGEGAGRRRKRRSD